MLPDPQDPGRLYESRLKHVSMQNKERTLAGFVREQKKNLEYYAKEGKRVMESIDASRSELSHAAKVKESSTDNPPKETNAFDLPMLKPRRIEPLAFTSNQEEVAAQSKRKVNRKVVESDEESEEIAKLHSRPINDKKAIQRREGLSDSEIKRLDDRRERKKNLREIMKPKGGVKEAPKAKSKKLKEGVSKGPIDTAFMHGLVSTKVGKKRLTLQPFQTNIGVFNKGKTSTKIDIQAAIEKKRHDTMEQPSKNKGGAKSRKRSHKFEAKALEEHANVTSSESESVTSNVDSPPIKRTRRRSPGLPSVSLMERSDSFKGNSAKSKPYDPADSVVWDIEASSIILGSQPGEVLASRTSYHDGDSRLNANLLTIAQQSNVSLAPSQSASQAQRTPPEESTRGSPVADQISRYFFRPSKLDPSKNNSAVQEVSPVEKSTTFDWKQLEKNPKSESELEFIPNSPPKVRSSYFSGVAQEVARHLVKKRPAITPKDDDASSLYYQEERQLLHPLSDWSFYPALDQESECDADLESHMDEQSAGISGRVDDWQGTQIVHWDKANNAAVMYDSMQNDDWAEAQAGDIWETVEAFHDQGPESDDNATMGAIMEDIWSSYLPESLYPDYGDEHTGGFADETGRLEGNTELSVCQSEDHQRFYQGKFLLDRIRQEANFGVQNAVTEAEQEVAGRLGQGYWFQQKLY